MGGVRQAARHTHAVRSRLLDLVDLLLGWRLEPELPAAVGWVPLDRTVMSQLHVFLCCMCGSETVMSMACEHCLCEALGNELCLSVLDMQLRDCAGQVSPKHS